MLRAGVVVLLVVFGTVLVTLSVPAVWGRKLVVNTDRYVETVTPLGTDPGIQAAVVVLVTVALVVLVRSLPPAPPPAPPAA